MRILLVSAVQFYGNVEKLTFLKPKRKEICILVKCQFFSVYGEVALGKNKGMRVLFIEIVLLERRDHFLFLLIEEYILSFW